MMKLIMKYKFVTTFLVFLLIGFGCKQETPIEEITEQEVPLEEENEKTFGDFETLPEWLQDVITTEKTKSLIYADGYIRAEKGEWKKQVIYNIHKQFESHLFSFYDENGNEIDANLAQNVHATSENWTWVYEWAKGYLCQMFGKGTGSMSGPRTRSVPVFEKREIKDKYHFPDISKMNDWERPNIIQERLTALQIPDAILASISTEGLLETCLEFPYLINIFHSENFQKGFEQLQAQFNGFREVLKRS